MTHLKIYVISMKNASYRRERMIRLLTDLDLPFEFVDGVDGTALSRNEMSRFCNFEEMSLSHGEFGCLLSHVQIWRQLASEEPGTHAVVMEDDIHVAPNLKDLLKNAMWDEKSLGICRLETMLASVNVSIQPMQKVHNYAIHEMLSAHGGTAGYVVNQKTAYYLESVYLTMRHAVDIELFAADRSSLRDLKIYQVIPAPCIQDMSLPRRSRDPKLASMIGQDREDARIGLVGRENVFIRWIKWRFRPIYLFFKNISLKRQGVMRVRIEFG